MSGVFKYFEENYVLGTPAAAPGRGRRPRGARAAGARAIAPRYPILTYNQP